MNEFNIVKKYFERFSTIKRKDILQGIGDDAALLKPPSTQTLAVTTDTLVAGRHFLKNAAPFEIGYKALAVNLSDLAAMGATPAWFTLALTMPTAHPTWLRAFSRGLFALAKKESIALIGGNLSRGPLTITIQATGFVPAQHALYRHGAQPNDNIYVTGTLGDAGLAYLQKQLHRPISRIACGKQLRGVAHAAIDISDGLIADLKHLLTASHVGAHICFDQIPLSKTLRAIPHKKALRLALTAGEDYELCFTVPTHQSAALKKRLTAIHCPYTMIGTITKNKTIQLTDTQGAPYHGSTDGYQHF